MAQTVDEMTQYTAVGKPTRRQDALDKVLGHARFAGDISIAGLLHARLVVSPYAHARVLAIDASAALEIPGVKAVYTSESLGMKRRENGSRVQAPLAHEEVVWCGHPVAIVLAEAEAAAEDGAAAVDVEYEPLCAVIDPIVAMHSGVSSPYLSKEDKSSKFASGDAHATFSERGVEEQHEEVFSQNMGKQVHFHAGDMALGWREAEVIVERTYTTSFVHQSYLEPQSILAVPSALGHRVTIWASSQGMLSIRSSIAEALNTSERDVHVEPVSVGGGFGGKLGLVEPLAAAAAFASRKPVRLVYTRSEDLLAGNPAPQSVITVKLGAKLDGTLVAIQAKAIFDTGSYADAPLRASSYILSKGYSCPNFDVRCYEVLTNKVGAGAYRAPGGPQATFALESAVDELCQALGMDPIAFRLKNALQADDLVQDQPTLQSPTLGLCLSLERAREHPLWTKRVEHKVVPSELNGWKIGVGVAAGTWLGGTEPTAATCRLEADGTITLIVGTVDLTGSDTSLALIVAEVLSIAPESVYVMHSNTDTMPYSGGTAGSKTIYSMGPAVLAAAQDARKQILTIAADELETAVGDLDIDDGKVVVRGLPSRNIALTTIASLSMRFAGQHKPVYGRGRAAIKTNSPVFATHLAKVAVDPETGEVRVLDYIAVHDVGFAINPAEVEGQIYGGVVQGIGWALLERLVYDESGQLLTPTLMEYAMPQIGDVPPITPILVEVPSAFGPFGAKSVGEPPVIPVGAAIANAIFDAIGVRVAQLPITSERLFTALCQHSV